MASNAKEKGDDPKVIREKLKTIISQDRNLRTRDRIPKLVAIILDTLPAPRVVTSWTGDGRPYKIARLAYTARILDLSVYLKKEDIPSTKIDQDVAPSAPQAMSGLATNSMGKKYANLVPWYAYKNLPDAEKNNLKGALPPYTYRFKRACGKKARKSERKKRDAEQVEVTKATHAALKASGVPSSAALEALSQSTFDFELHKQEDASLDVYWPSSQVPFPKASFTQQGKAYKFDRQGAWCPAHFQAVTFAGLNSVDASLVAKMLNKAFTYKARVVDLWQYDVMCAPEADAGPIAIKSQQYKALVLLLADRSSEDGKTVTGPALDIKEALNRLPGYFEIAPGRHAKLTYPERAGHCSRCFRRGCHSYMCREMEIYGCPNCGEFHGQSCDSEEDMDNYYSEDY